MSSFEEIGALLGFVAFAGLAVLVFLTFQQGRHLRRLRDWAGRAPERAAALAARGEDPEDDPEAEELSEEEVEAATVLEPTRFDHLRAGFAERWAALDRRMPVEPKILLGGLAAIILGVGIATSGFGLLGGDDGAGVQAGNQNNGGKNKAANGGNGGEKQKKTEVAVLNGTAPPGGTGVVGIADQVSGDVEGAGFKVGTVDNAGSFTTSTVMFVAGSPEVEAEAQDLADALEPLLGVTTVAEMSAEVEALAGGADLALIVGQDDSTI